MSCLTQGALTCKYHPLCAYVRALVDCSKWQHLVLKRTVSAYLCCFSASGSGVLPSCYTMTFCKHTVTCSLERRISQIGAQSKQDPWKTGIFDIIMQRSSSLFLCDLRKHHSLSFVACPFFPPYSSYCIWESVELSSQQDLIHSLVY